MPPHLPDQPDDLLSLQEAADHLKVHYMTAYRWVRHGDLPAMKTGGRLRVRSDDLARFLTERQVDVALPSSSSRRTDWPLHIDRLSRHLLDGAGVEAASLVRKVVADGAPAGEVYIRLLAPTLHRIGTAWAVGDVGIAVEHRASAIVGGLVARLGEAFRRRGPRRGTAVTLTPAPDRHALAGAMVADFLRAAGYEVHHLGADLPAAGLAAFLETVPTDVVAVSATAAVEVPLLRGLVKAVQEETLVVVGGQGASREDVEAVGAIHIPDLAELPDRLLTAGAALRS